MAEKTKKAAKSRSSKANPKKSEKKGARLLKSLPESFEHLKVVQRVADVIEEMHERAQDVKAEARNELKKLIKLYQGNYEGLEKKLHEATNEAKKQAQLSMLHLLQKWHDNKEKLPKALTSEIEKIVGQIGAKGVRKIKTVSKKVATKTEAKKEKKAPVKTRTKAAATTAKKTAVTAKKTAPKKRASSKAQTPAGMEPTMKASTGLASTN